MLGPEAEQRRDELAPAEVPEAEGLARRVEAQVAAWARAVEATQRLWLVPERRELVPQRPPVAWPLEGEPPKVRLPEGSPAA
jgi:hypothetical protein